MKFQIEYCANTLARPYVIARQLDAGTFSVSKRSRLGGIAIQPFISMPRASTSDGKPDMSVFVFTPVSAREFAGLKVGQIVELSESNAE